MPTRQYLYLVLAVLVSLMSPAVPAAFESENQTSDVFRLSIAELLRVEVITASKSIESRWQSPGILTVYTAEEIALFGGRDMGEVLAKIPGLETFDSLHTGRHRLTIRADQPRINNNHVLMLLNGTPLNRESYTGGIWTQAMLLAIPLPIIARIEVVRGPGSVLYGTNAFSGVINIITKELVDAADTVSVGVGNHDTRSIDLAGSAVIHDFDLVGSLSYYDSDGWPFRTVATTGSVFRDDARSENLSFMGTLRRGGFYAAGYWGEADQFTIRGSEVEPVAGRTVNEKYFLDFGYEHKLTNGWRIKTNVSHVGGRTDHHVVGTGNNPLLVIYKTNDSRFELTTLGPLSERLKLLVGGTVEWLSGTVPPPAVTVPDWSDQWWSLYGQLDFQIGDTSFIAGGQYNKTEDASGSFVPRLGVIHHFTTKTGIKVLFSRAFRSPY